MQHLALLTRLRILEEHDGAADINDTEVKRYIDEWQRPSGIGDYSFESEPVARETLRVMNVFYGIFEGDITRANGTGVREFKVEYFILSIYLLLRHILKHYVFDAAERDLFRRFVYDFYQRWKARREDDNDLLVFSDHRQQTGRDIETRQRILRQIFFEYAQENGHALATRDERRAFSEAERIKLYRDSDGLCALCVEEGKPEAECRVPWSEYDADHVVPHHLGGCTELTNAQLLCQYHNRSKGAVAPAVRAE